jgi:hypothetical protein
MSFQETSESTLDDWTLPMPPDMLRKGAPSWPVPRFLPYRLELADGSLPVSASRPAADEIPARELLPPPPLSLLVADERAL